MNTLTQRWTVLAALGLCSALVVAPALVHFDEVDSQTYQTVVRNMVADGSWLSLRYLPQVYPSFFEQVPFGLWPYALAVKLFGEGALPVVATLFTLATLALVALVGLRRGGPVSAALAMLLLGTCESFFLYGSRPLLEPSLVFFTTLAVTPLLLGPMSARGWAVCLGASAVATLIKGPFGLLPVCAFGLAHAISLRSFKALGWAALTAFIAALPLSAFLLSEPAWWMGYLEQHVLASTTGAREEFHQGRLFLFVSIAERLWPALIAAGLGAALAWRRRAGLSEAARHDWAGLGLGTLLLLALLTIPVQKNWTHALVAYPFLSLLGALAVAPWLEPSMRAPPRAARLRLGIVTLALVTWVAAGLGVGRLLLPRPCIVSTGALSAQLKALPPMTPVAVVSDHPWSTVALLAAEGRLAPVVASLADPAGASLAVVQLDRWAPQEGWRELGRERDWVLVTR